MFTDEFSDFDGEEMDNFDPENDNTFLNATGSRKKRSAAPSMGSALVTVKIASAVGSAKRVQLFGAMGGVHKIANTVISALNPATSDLTTGAPNNQNLIYFDKDGNLIYNHAGSLITISCSEVPYRQLVDATLTSPIKIQKIRMAVTTDGQIDNALYIRRRTMFGKEEQDSINPRVYFNPDQNQGKIIDVPKAFIIDAEKSMDLLIQANETVSLSMTISQFKKNFGF